MSDAARRRWYVEDRIAHQALVNLEDDAEAIRLDRPGWHRVGDVGDPPVGLVVGTGARASDLAGALVALARQPRTTLVLPDGDLSSVDWLVAGAAWRLADEPTVEDGVVVLHIAPDGAGPTVATITSLHRRREQTTVRQRPPWRIHLDGAAAERWFGDVTTSDNRVVLEVDDGEDDVVRVALGSAGREEHEDVRLEVTDDPLRAAEGVLVVARPVDLRRFSPVGCDPRGATGSPVLPISVDAPPEGVADARAAAREVGEAAVAAGTLERADVTELAVPGDGTPSGRDVHLLREAIALLDHPRVHASPAHHARWLLCAVAAGVPVVLLAPLPTPVAGLVGGDVAHALAAATVADVLDPDLRERTSVLQRRQVLAAHTSPRRLRDLGRELGLRVPAPRTVSIVLATNRADFLEHACTQVARQDWPRREVVVVTHAALQPSETRRVLDEHLGDVPTTLLHEDADRSLGEALNLGVERASGELVTKFDDDDWYSPSHVTDVVTGLEYSGADVTGKAAEFLHLGLSGTTMRRWGRGGERPSTTVAGATMTFPRDVWRDVAGFPHVSLAEDRGFVEEVVAAGGTSYRMHPFGFLVNRHGRHAWDVTEEEFLAEAVATRPGPDHDWTLT